MNCSGIFYVNFAVDRMTSRIFGGGMKRVRFATHVLYDTQTDINPIQF